MNAPYLILGLLCGLAIGYAFGWQRRRKDRRLIEGSARLSALREARRVVDSNHCDGESQWAHGINEGRRVSLTCIDYLMGLDGECDCSGGTRCTTCPGKDKCKTGCYRQAEYTGRPAAS